MSEFDELKAAAEALIAKGSQYRRYEWEEFLELAQPAVILNLLSERASERETADHWRDLAEQRQKRIYELAAEVNRVKDENEVLRNEITKG